MSNISYSTLGFVDRDLEAALDGVAAAGFTQTEIMGQAPHLAVPPEGKALADFRARLAARGLRARTVHAPLTRNVLGAPEEGWRLEVVEVLAGYLRLAGGLEATEVVIHPVPNPIFVPEADHPEVPRRIAEAVPRSLDQLVPVAGREGVRILLENLPYACAYPYLAMQELRALVDGYPEEQLGLVIDTGTRLDDEAGPCRWKSRSPDPDFRELTCRMSTTTSPPTTTGRRPRAVWTGRPSARRWPRWDIPAPGPLKSPGGPGGETP